MALRLVNTAPGDVTSPVKPGQSIYMGLKSETLSTQIASLNVGIGLTNCQHHGAIPTADTSLSAIGASVALETSERRRPVSASAGISLSSGNLLITKTTNGADELSVYEITIPTQNTTSLLGYFKFRKKNAWALFNPDWCNLTNLAGMYFGLEHGGLNTAAYAFLRNNGSGGSVVFGGPLQSLNTARPGQLELATDLDAVTAGTQGWMSLADNSVLEFFIYINQYTSPHRAEFWSRTGTGAPIYQGVIPLTALGTFPNTLYTNSRSGPSNVARLFFGNLGRTGDILQLDDWALYPDYRAAIVAGLPTANHSLAVLPDTPATWSVRDVTHLTETPVGRWFEATGTGYITPAPAFYYDPGQYKTPRYLSFPKTGLGRSAYVRKEPRFESLQDGMMFEAYMAVGSTLKVGDLVGPGFFLEDGLNSYKVLALETTAQKGYGIAGNDATYSNATSYHTTPFAVDWGQFHLVRLTVDHRRSKVSLFIDESKQVDLGIDTPAQINSSLQPFPTTALTGKTLTVSISTNGGTSWVSRTHTFSGEVADAAALATALNGDATFIGSGGTQLLALDRGSTFGIKTVALGAVMGLRVEGTSTSVSSGVLKLTAGVPSYGQQSTFPLAPDTLGRVGIGHPYLDTYTAELKLREVNYLTRYLAWEGEDSLLPDSTALDAGVRFTRFSNGGGSQGVDGVGVAIVKTGFLSSSEYRYYKINQSFNNVGGLQIDFGTTLIAYTDELGQIGAANIGIDAGLIVYLGDKRLYLNFFDCGAYGKRIGILSPSCTETDILNQTAVGKTRSFAVDWSQFHRYRLSVRAFQGIDIWVDDFAAAPVLSLPWRNNTDGFDLPLDITSPAFAFGHFNLLSTPTSSTTEWQYFRWGFSNGFEVAIQQHYPDGYPKYLFGGREFILSEFDES